MSTVFGAVDDLLAFDATLSPWTPVAGERVVIYGAGAFARSLARIVRAAGGDVLYALDRRARDVATLDGVSVHHPGEEPLAVAGRASVTAVVGVFNREADPAEIEASLRSLGYGRVVGVPELYEAFATKLGSRFWLAGRVFYAKHRAQIEAADDLWADAPSRDLYRSLLRYRVRWDAAAAPRPVEAQQYFPDDVPRGREPMRFIDCGAFTGDTLSAVAALGEPVEQVYAFEPDLEHFARLAEYAPEFARATGAQLVLWPCAVAARSSARRFQADRGEAGHLTNDGERVVTAVSLDAALPTAVATDLKMDIEGAELEALRGAERLIRRARPRLAICVYHRAEHLWEIPLFVQGLGLAYDFHLRSHGHFGFDVVMYAVPRALS